KWDYRMFGAVNPAAPAAVDETIDLTFAKDNAAVNGFNRWLINGAAFSMEQHTPTFSLREGGRYLLRMHNASDDIHPMHLHRHIFELTSIAGRPTSGVMKDVVML